MEWSEEHLQRYSRHIVLEDIGIEGQERICNAKVLIIGAGGLGSPVGLYLAAAGVGEIGIADGDVVEISNLQRQIFHTTNEIGLSKVQSARKKILAINPTIKVNAYETMLDASNILEIVSYYDFVVDGSDNFATKFLINDACVLANRPYSHGGILRFGGQTMTINPHKSACYACIFDSPPSANTIPTCSSAGVLGAVAGMLGTIQATEILKLITQVGEPLFNRLLNFDAKSMNFRTVSFRKNPKCRVCGEKKITTLKDYEVLQCRA